MPIWRISLGRWEPRCLTVRLWIRQDSPEDTTSFWGWTPSELHHGGKDGGGGFQRWVKLIGSQMFWGGQEQLGLKLSGGRAAVDVLVVDRVERPSRN